MKTRTAVLGVVALMLTIVTTAAASTVKYDYDREVDFSKGKSLAWQTPESPQASLTERRIRRSLKAGFEAKGYSFTDSVQKVDFVVSYRGTAWRDVRVNGNFSGPGFGRYVRVDQVPMGVLIVDVFERATGRLAWHGTVSDAIASNPEQADEKMAKAVAALLKKFPPIKGS